MRNQIENEKREKFKASKIKIDEEGSDEQAVVVPQLERVRKKKALKQQEQLAEGLLLFPSVEVAPHV